MAIAETCFAPVFYLWLTFHVGWLLPLYIAAAIAPFVLLRSDKSVALGVKWALRLDRDEPSEALSNRWFALGAAAIASYWLLAIAFWSPPFPVGHAIQSAAILGAVLLFPPILLAPFLVFLMAVAIRITATAVFWREGLQSLPENFRVLILCVSPSQFLN
jgi:hypothetical protein